MSVMNCRDRPLMCDAELKSCGSLAVLAEVLRSVRSESTGCIIACLTNFLVSPDSDAGGGSSSSAGLRIEPVLQDIRGVVLDFCQEQPERSWFVAPPMYRTTPQWYLDGLSGVMLKFSQLMSKDKPKNLYLLPSFSSPALEQDGVHLTPYAGFEYVYNLFYSAADLLTTAKKPAAFVQTKHSESIRVLEDRVLVIEQDHKRLNQSVESKNAVSAEAADYTVNLR